MPVVIRYSRGYITHVPRSQLFMLRIAGRRAAGSSYATHMLKALKRRVDKGVVRERWMQIKRRGRSLEPRVGGSIGASSMAFAIGLHAYRRRGSVHSWPLPYSLRLKSTVQLICCKRKILFASNRASSLLCALPFLPRPASQRADPSSVQRKPAADRGEADIRGIIRRTCSDIASCTIVVPPTIDPLLFLSRPFRPRCLCLFFCRLASPFSQSLRPTTSKLAAIHSRSIDDDDLLGCYVRNKLALFSNKQASPSPLCI
jgi:hypothetical protein